MLDIKLIRENPSLVEENLKKRNDPEKIKLLKELIVNDKDYRDELQEMEELKHKRNVISEEIAKTKKEGKDASEKMKEAAELPGKIKSLEEHTSKLKEKID
jgi:seryl-tRNA synthetase